MGIFGRDKKKHSSLVGPTLAHLYEIVPPDGYALLTGLLSGAPSGSEILIIYSGPEFEAFQKMANIIKKTLLPDPSVIAALRLAGGGVMFVKGDFTETAFAELPTQIRQYFNGIMRADVNITSGRYAASELREPPKKGDVPATTGTAAGDTSVGPARTVPGPTAKALATAEAYISRDHPLDASSKMLGIRGTRPAYTVVSNQVGRSSYPHIDMKIVSVASCLPGEDIALNDTQKVARMALEAIQHYASLPGVQAFFLAPYHLRTGTASKGSTVPPEEECRVYAGVENLLLDIYDELPPHGTITDEIVEQRVHRLLNSN